MPGWRSIWAASMRATVSPLGYNPTDYFRTGANRSIVSIDPVSLKTRRQGSVMLRGQRLWDGGSLTALVSPKLASEPNDGAFDLDFGATNYDNRMLVAYSQRVGDSFTPQVLLFKEGAQSPQVGLNLTSVLGSAAVAYFEWSGGRSRRSWGKPCAGRKNRRFARAWQAA